MSDLGAIAPKSDILSMDEPLINLDADIRSRFYICFVSYTETVFRILRIHILFKLNYNII